MVFVFLIFLMLVTYCFGYDSTVLANTMFAELNFLNHLSLSTSIYLHYIVMIPFLII